MKLRSSLLPGLVLMLCIPLFAWARFVHTTEQLPAGTVDRSLVLSYAGQAVSSVEVAGRPDLETDKFMSLVAQHSGEALSFLKIDQSLAALKGAGQFQDVQ